MDKGAFMMNWEERGVRNHIMQEAALCLARCISVALFEERSVELFQKKMAPMTVTAKASSLRCTGRNISWAGVRIIQFSDAPPIIAARLRNVVGAERKKSWSLILCRGREAEGAHIVAAKNRAVYAAVSPVAKKNSEIIMILLGLNSVNSRMRSLE